MGRAYRSDSCLMGTAGGDLSQTYTYAYDSEDGSLKQLDISVNDDYIEETVYYYYDSLKRLSEKSFFLTNFDLDYDYGYERIVGNRTSNYKIKFCLFIRMMIEAL